MHAQVQNVGAHPPPAPYKAAPKRLASGGSDGLAFCLEAQIPP